MVSMKHLPSCFEHELLVDLVLLKHNQYIFVSNILLEQQLHYSQFDTFRSEQNGWHTADDILKCYLLIAIF